MKQFEFQSHLLPDIASNLESALGIRVRNNGSIRRHHPRDNANPGTFGDLLVNRQRVSRVKVLVDDAGHAHLAVVPDRLRTIVPDGRLVLLDHDLEDVGRLGLPLGHGLEPAEEGLRREWNARVGKRGLRDAVVARQEVPLDDVPDLGDDILRVKEEGTAAAGDDGVGHACLWDSARGEVVVGACRGGRGWGGGGEGGDPGEDREDDGLVEGAHF